MSKKTPESKLMLMNEMFNLRQPLLCEESSENVSVFLFLGLKLKR